MSEYVVLINLLEIVKFFIRFLPLAMLYYAYIIPMNS